MNILASFRSPHSRKDVVVGVDLAYLLVCGGLLSVCLDVTIIQFALCGVVCSVLPSNVLEASHYERLLMHPWARKIFRKRAIAPRQSS